MCYYVKMISHISAEENPVYLEAWDENWFDNRAQPIVRHGGEVFQVHFKPEIRMEIFTVDPRRSMVEPLWKAVDENDNPSVAVDDFLACFVSDIGLLPDRSCTASQAAQVAFHTMLPDVVAKRLAQSWMRLSCFLPQHRDIVRVVNNPFFYADAHVSEKQLLEIAQDSGCTYAVDRSVEIPSAEMLAHEIAIVNHIQDGKVAIAKAECEILQQVKLALG